MRKVEIAARIAEELNITKEKAEDAVNAILDEVKQALSEGEPVILRRFGTFQVRHNSRRLGRNPKTGEEAEIAARRVVRFKPGRHLKETLNSES